MISERVIQYAVRKFEVSLRMMSRDGYTAHGFTLSDNPPLLLLISIVPPEALSNFGIIEVSPGTECPESKVAA